MFSRRLAAVYVFCAIVATAQEDVKDRAATLHQAVFDPMMKSNVSSPSVQLALDGSIDQGTATGKVGFFINDVTLEAKLSAPIGKTAKQATLVDLDGLANKATADFGFTWTKWDPKADGNKQRVACESFLISQGLAQDVAEADDFLAQKGPKTKDAAPALLHSCVSLKLTGKYKDQFDKAVKWGTPILVTGRTKFGREKYDFVRSPAFADLSETHTSYAVTGALGVIIPSGDFIQASFQYQKAYQATDSQQVCSPFDNSVSLHCRDISVGAPAVQRKKIVEFEARIFPSGNFGLNPKVDYDVAVSAVSLQLPLYMFHAKEGGLNGGVTAGWRSDTKTFKVAVFIGQVFTLLQK